MRRLLGTFMVTALTLAVLASDPASAPVTNATTPPESRVESTIKFRIAEHDLYPESIAFDPVSGDFFLSSMGRPGIIRIHVDGTYEDFLSGEIPGLASSIGLKVDAKRRTLWVCTGRFSLLADYDATPPRTGVLQFDIDSGELIRSWMLEQDQESPYHIFNDLALTAAGEAFATTTLLGRLYKIPPDGEAMVLVDQLDPGSNNNGIAVGPNEKYLFVTVDRKIHRLELATGEVVPLTVPNDEDLGTDGLYYYEGSLIAVKPRFKKISRLFLDDAFTKVIRVESLVDDHPDLVYPTTGVLVGDSLVYVATSFADSPRKDGAVSQHPDVLIHEIVLRSSEAK
jgi:sugar lactone lactonase YvrE